METTIPRAAFSFPAGKEKPGKKKTKKPPTAGSARSNPIPRKLGQSAGWPSLSPFAQAVLAAVYSIPKGETRTYAQVAKMAGRLSANRRLSASYSRAFRAVGSVLAKNPYAPLVPYAESLRSSSNGPLVRVASDR